jgi:muramoyltetrapeptide carboxypeptidase
VAEGPLLVANLTVATHLLGTPHLPALAGAILVLEDVGEAPYRIDRMLTHWRLSGALGQLAGIAFGAFSDCEDDAEDVDAQDQAQPAHADRDAHLRSSRCCASARLDLGIPVLAGLPAGTPLRQRRPAPGGPGQPGCRRRPPGAGGLATHPHPAEDPEPAP